MCNGLGRVHPRQQFACFFISLYVRRDAYLVLTLGKQLSIKHAHLHNEPQHPELER